ncbi:hypothetical protein AR158_c353L [Paramecium bursaria Chlorella virus AR158]|uniref:hypothetical protein n=1 Tax=Paramecium bursaria Chlorella virus AR158 TaxID=380598 RepID=UPI00015AA948|nr:hypothetical protein AR158_c353L [Paramecium bursaria Chlorella virus AR158]ABU43898.1 hypothetical protein AR158_c353L [Paramecium bursaria Chlorella virus AR158]
MAEFFRKHIFYSFEIHNLSSLNYSQRRYGSISTLSIQNKKKYPANAATPAIIPYFAVGVIPCTSL